MQMYPSGSQPSEQDVLAQAWWSRAFELVDWFTARLVNRTDAHGVYRRTPEGVTALHRPGAPTVNRLLIHIAAERPEEVLALHVVAPDETCGWVGIDLDNHGNADPAANLRFALHVLARARSLGFSAILVDSDGRGGFHIWVLFGARVPAAVAWRFAKFLVRDHADFGLAGPPETFPKSPALSGKRMGHFLRLPGRHPKRLDHWSRVWGGDRWLEGSEAVAAILATGPSDADPAQVVPDDYDPRRRPGTAAAGPAGVRLSSRATAPGPVVSAKAPAPRHPEREVARAREALGYLNGRFRDDYDSWLRVGLALRQLGDDGLALWHEWSASSPKYDPAVLDARWAGFAGDAAPGRISLGTVFHWAKAEGWAVAARAGSQPRRGSFRIAVASATTGAAGEGAR